MTPLPHCGRGQQTNTVFARCWSSLLVLAVLLAQLSIAAGAAEVVDYQDFDDGVLPGGNWGGWDSHIQVSTDPAQNLHGSAGSIYAVYPERELPGYFYVWAGLDVAHLATRDIYVDFWAKMPGLKRGLKFLKVFGGRPDTGGYANTTFGLDYTGVDLGGMYCVSYGDGAERDNDTANIILFDGGSWAGYPGRGSESAHIATPQHRIWASADWGTAWHHFRMRVKFNSGTTAENEVPDGAFYVEIDGAVYVDATGIFNRHYSNPPIDRIELFGWTQADGDRFEIWYDEVKVTTGGFDGESPPPNTVPLAQAQQVDVPSGVGTAVTLTGSDADGDALVYAIMDLPAHGSLSGSGAARVYTPAAGYHGSDGFTFFVNDGIASSAVVTVSITVADSADGGGDPVARQAGGSGGGCGAGGAAGLLAGLALALALGLRSAGAGGLSRSRRWLPVLLLAMLSWPVLMAQEHHVDGGLGADAAAGDAAHPWRTINHAATQAVPGDTVVIHAGTYALTQQIGFTNSGTAELPIRYVARSGDTVLIDGGAGYCLGLQARSHLIFQNLDFTTSSTVVGAGMVYMEATNHCEFTGCSFRGMPAPVGGENTSVIRCMGTEGGFSTGCVFRNNLFADNLSPALRLYDTDGWIIENNEFRNCDQAIGGKDQPFNMLVRRNLIVGGGLAFYFAGQGGSSHVTITENIVIGAWSGFMTGGLGTYDNPREDVNMFNNTFYDCDTFIVGWNDGFTRSQSYYNNICYAGNAMNHGGGDDFAGRLLNIDKYAAAPNEQEHYLMDWNDLFIPAHDTSPWFIYATDHAQGVAAWTALTGYEAHSISADPLFVDAAAGDYHLSASSPCRGIGRYGEDLGAYPRGNDGTVIGRTSVSNVNTAPVAVDQSLSTTTNTARTITLTASDVDGDPLTWSIVTAPLHGVLSGSGADRTYTPDSGFVGSDSIAFRVNDGMTYSNLATIAISVTAGGGGGGSGSSGGSGGSGGGCGAGGAVGLFLGLGLALGLGSHSAGSGRASGRGRWLAILLLAGLGWSMLAAQEYHVDGSLGADAGAGDAAHPWRTVNHAATVATAGDTVVIHAGTYALAQQLAFAHSGSAGLPIRYMARTGDTVVIDGGTGYCMSLQFRSHLVFQGLHFTTASTAVGAGMVYMEGTNFCEFTGCEFRGMPAEVGAENTAVIRCMGTEGGFSTGCVFRNNLFVDHQSPALRLYDTDGWIIENNEFRNCLQAVGGKDQPMNMLVRRNLIVGGDLAFYFAGQGGASQVAITENVIIGSNAGFVIGGLGTYGNLREHIDLFNNSFYGCRGFIAGSNDGYTRSQSYYNNIVFSPTALNIHPGEDWAGRLLNIDKYASSPIEQQHYLMDWNCLSIPAPDTSRWFIYANQNVQGLAAWQSITGYEAHSISADPLFADAAGGNFHLLPDSPCRGIGRYGEDLGAYPRGNDGTVIGRTSVSNVNTAPVAVDQSLSATTNTARTITLTASDVDGDPLTWSIVTAPLHGVLSGSGADRTYTPDSGFVGSDSIAFRVNDGMTYSNLATIAISVTGGGSSGTSGGSGGSGGGCGAGGLVGLVMGLGLMLRVRRPIR